VDCVEVLTWLESRGLFRESPPLITKSRLCQENDLRIPAPPFPEVLALPETLFFSEIESLRDSDNVCLPSLTARPDCGLRFWRPLVRRVRPEPPSELRALWAITPGRNEDARFAAWREVLKEHQGEAELFSAGDKEAFLNRVAQGVEGLFLIAHGDEEQRGFWLRRGAGAWVAFSELREALLAMPLRLRFFVGFLCDSDRALYKDLLRPLAEAGKLDADFAGLLFKGSPKHDWGPRFMRVLLRELRSKAAAHDPAPFLYALARARHWLFREAGREEAARPLAFMLRPQAQPWPGPEERRYLARLYAMLEAGGEGA